MGFIDSIKSILKLGGKNIPDSVKTQINDIIDDEKQTQNIFEIIAKSHKPNTKVNLSDGTYIIGTLEPKVMHFRFEVSHNSEIIKVESIHQGISYIHESYKNLYSDTLAYIVNGDKSGDYHWVKVS